MTLDTTIELMAGFIADQRRGYVCLCTVNEIVASLRDSDIRAALHRAWLTMPDGMPLVWWGQREAQSPVSRVDGPELLRRAIADHRHRNTRHYFYGGSKPAVTRKMVNAMRRANPAAGVVGWSSPSYSSFDPQEIAAAADAINRARPDIVWVGLDGPMQALWMAAMRPRLEASLLIGVGATFETLAGGKPQPPSWMQSSRLDWAFRMVTEKRRPWSRGLVCNTLFVGHALASFTHLARYPLPLEKR